MVTSCQTCGLVLEIAEDSGQKYICPECSSVVARSRDEVKMTLMLSITALILMIPAAVFPFISIMINDIVIEASILDTANIMFKDGYILTGGVIFTTALVFPILYLLSIICISTAYISGINIPFLWVVLRSLVVFEHFQMTDVFIVGILVSIVKLIDMSDITLGTGFYFLLITSVMIVSIDLYHNRHLFQYRRTNA